LAVAKPMPPSDPVISADFPVSMAAPEVCDCACGTQPQPPQPAFIEAVMARWGHSAASRRGVPITIGTIWH
jgi:hypothetical protein